MKISMSRKDARVLVTILERIGGSPAGPRGAANRILTELDYKGIEPIYECGSKIPGIDNSDKCKQLIYFPDKWPSEQDN